MMITNKKSTLNISGTTCQCNEYNTSFWSWGQDKSFDASTIRGVVLVPPNVYWTPFIFELCCLSPPFACGFMHIFYTNFLMCNLLLSTTPCCKLLLSPCWLFLTKPWKWRPLMMQELIAGVFSPNKTMEVKPTNDEGACCRRSFSHHENVQTVIHKDEFMSEHSTYACKAISGVTSISQTQFFCWKK